MKNKKCIEHCFMCHKDNWKNCICGYEYSHGCKNHSNCSNFTYDKNNTIIMKNKFKLMTENNLKKTKLNIEQLSFNFDYQNNNINYIFENKLQEKLFNKILLNHHWKNKYTYGQDFWKEQLYIDILNIDYNNLQKIIDILYKKCSLCKLQYYGWPENENK